MPSEPHYLAPPLSPLYRGRCPLSPPIWPLPHLCVKPAAKVHPTLSSPPIVPLTSSPFAPPPQVVAKARGQLDGTWGEPNRGRLPLNESLAFMRYTLVHPESSKRMLPAFNGVGLSGARPPSPSAAFWEEEKDAAALLLDPLLGPGAGAAAAAAAAAMLRPVVHCPPPAHVAAAVNAIGEGPLQAARCYAPSVFQVGGVVCVPLYFLSLLSLPHWSVFQVGSPGRARGERRGAHIQAPPPPSPPPTYLFIHTHTHTRTHTHTATFQVVPAFNATLTLTLTLTPTLTPARLQRRPNPHPNPLP